jgi:hypothetical protein
MNIIFAIFILMLFNDTAFPEDNVEIELQRELFEPEGIQTMRLIDAELNYTKEKGIYMAECQNKISAFYRKSTILFKKENSMKYLGKWILVDKNNNIIKKTSISSPGEYFNIVVDDDNKLRYRVAELRSYLYSNNNGLYISPNFHFTIISKLIFINNHIYFYILENNKWILDPIHDNGNHYYIKASQ